MQRLLTHHEAIKNLGQAVAWLAAAAFFGWKVVVGYSFINMSVALKTERFRHDAASDRVRVRLELTKGDRASLLLEDIVFRVVLDSAATELREERLSEVIGLEKQFSETLRLTPGESTHFERVFEIPTNAVARVDVRIKGKSFFRGQWRASAVTIPEDRQESRGQTTAAERKTALDKGAVRPPVKSPELLDALMAQFKP